MALRHPRSVLAYFERVGAEVLNFRRAIIKEYVGNYYKEIALIRIWDDGRVTCRVKEYAPTPEELALMQIELQQMDFPRAIIARNLDKCPIIHEPDVYEFWNVSRTGIIMLQQKRLIDGRKTYPCWIQMSDGEWYPMEPEKGLPFWKPMKKTNKARIMIHEGAKAAKRATEIVENQEDHPWVKELSLYEHWGMVGGALAPHRTDYDELSSQVPTEVVYVCDNDLPGNSALQRVSQAWGKSLKGIKFMGKFPESFDIGDDIPATLYSCSGRYTGPTLHEMMQPATWATKIVPPSEKGGRPTVQITEDFAAEWFHCIKPEVFVNCHWPNQIWTLSEFNSKVDPFSHVHDTGRFLKKVDSSKSAILKYKPGEPSGLITKNNEIYINTFIESRIKAERGDVSPWIDFQEYLFPVERDRFAVAKWIATLVAKPEVRILYGLLLISETQGVGKGTLGDAILKPLIGEDNTSTATEQDIVESSFNYWLPHKRLAIVHEIYAGNSYKAYNKLKSMITDGPIMVKKKYQAEYEIENQIHIYACSNSLSALKIDYGDRRWLIPEITEVKRDAAYFTRFYAWLNQEGGLQIIRQWADDFVAEHGYILHGEAPPDTRSKQKVIQDTMSDGKVAIIQSLEILKEKMDTGEVDQNAFFLVSDMQKYIRDTVYQGKSQDFLERPLTVKKICKAQGWSVGSDPVRISTWGSQAINSYIVSMNPQVAEVSPSVLAGRDVPPEQRRMPIPLSAVLTPALSL